MKDLLQALIIFLKYDDPRLPTHCEHDVLTINIDASKVSDEDIDSLEKLGFFVDDETGDDLFTSFRFGSC